MGPDRLRRLEHSDGAVDDAVDTPRALAGPVHNTELDGVQAEVAAYLVDQRFHGEGAYGRSGSAVGAGLRLVVHDVVAVYLDVLDVVGREHAGGGAAQGGARIGARLEGEARLHRRDTALLGHADLDLHVAAGGRTGGLQDLGPGHGHLHGEAALLGEQGSQRLQVGAQLAAEPSAYLHGHHLDAGDRQAQHCGRAVPDAEVSLAAAPYRKTVVRRPPGGSVLGLDVALVHGLRAELALEYPVGLPESLLNVPQLELLVARYVGRLPILAGR